MGLADIAAATGASRTWVANRSREIGLDRGSRKPGGNRRRPRNVHLTETAS